MDLHLYFTVLLARDGRDVPTQKEPALIYLILHISILSDFVLFGHKSGSVPALL